MSERESPGFKVHLEEEVGTNWRDVGEKRGIYKEEEVKERVHVARSKVVVEVA